MNPKVVKFTMQLEWKAHSVNLEMFKDAVKAIDPECSGSSADDNFRLHFDEVPSQETQDAVIALWEECDDEEHAMCAAYKSEEDIKAEKLAAKNAAVAALATASGLTQDQIKALLS